jgi:hypothetical protein
MTRGNSCKLFCSVVKETHSYNNLGFPYKFTQLNYEFFIHSQCYKVVHTPNYDGILSRMLLRGVRIIVRCSNDR